MGSYHHGNLQQALIDGAKELIAEVGPDGFTLRELARRVGVSHTAAYRHFADKEALKVAVAREGFEGLKAAFERDLDGVTDPVERFRRTGLRYVLFALENPSNFRVMFQMTQCADDFPALGQASIDAYQVLVDEVRGAQEAGLLRDEPVELLTLTAWSLVHGLARLMVDGAVDADALGDPEQVAGRVTGLLLTGLGR